MWPGNGPQPDASPGTFYSAMSNVDIEIGEGNPGAVAVRSRYAQHCFLAHMDFRIGSGLAGDARMEDISGPANTWVGTVQPDGSVTDMKLFANQGGEGVAAGKDGNVYIAAGQIYVYSPAGELIHTIEVPEKPLQVVFGGKDGRTLFIPARTSLYAVRP